MYLYLIRHGETQWNILKRTQGITDVGLTERGKEQARLLAEKLKNRKIQKLLCSDLKRAYDTAAIIGKSLGIEPIQTPLLREVCFGDWEGHTIEEIQDRFPGELEHWYSDTSFFPQNGESIDFVRRRVRSFIEQYLDHEIRSLEGLMVVSHAVICKILLTELLDLPIYFMRRFKMSNASINILKLEPHREASVILMNDTCHLDGISRNVL